MKRKIAPWLALSGLILALLACNLPTPINTDPAAVSTSVAQTVVAQMSASPVPLLVTATTAPGSLNTPPAASQATSTLVQPVATQTSVPCNQAQFVDDLSIPDGANLQIGSAFTKTWRLKNVGTCTWTSSYQLVFDHGDAMGGPAAQALTGAVAPDQTIDISVNLVAPVVAGTYKGFWKIRDQNGGVFGLSNGPFWVEIMAVSSTATPSPTPALAPPVGLITAPLVIAETGSVRSNGVVFNFVNVGDNEANLGQQGFLSFDISALPAGVTVLDVKIKFSDYGVLGNPFSLGCLRLYSQDYGTVDVGDFFSGATTGALERWCSTSELSATASATGLKAAVQSGVGSPRLRLRLQFNENATNGNGVGDMVQFGNGLQLLISFSH
jgi:hypothetical protein